MRNNRSTEVRFIRICAIERRFLANIAADEAWRNAAASLVEKRLESERKVAELTALNESLQSRASAAESDDEGDSSSGTVSKSKYDKLKKENKKKKSEVKKVTLSMSLRWAS